MNVCVIKIKGAFMENKNFVKNIRIAKTIQFLILLIIEIVFLFLLLRNPLQNQNMSFKILCVLVWILSIYQIIGLIYDIVTLRSLAQESNTLKRVAYLDALTGVPNRHGLDLVFRTYTTPDSMAQVGCCLMTIENLTSSNEVLGREMGDSMITHFCSMLETHGDSIGVVGRNNGNDFLLIVERCNKEIMDSFLENLNDSLALHNDAHPEMPIHVSSTYILNSEAHYNDFPHLLNAAYKKLYGEK